MPSDAWTANAEHIRGEMDLAGNCARPWEWPTINGTMYIGPGVILEAEMHEMVGNGVEIPAWDDLDATNLISQRYHLWRWERMHPGASIANMQTVVEIGGGYGAMAIVCSRLGFRGDYYIEDLPVLRELQARHLPERDVRCNIYHGLNDKPDVLIAACSLSEMPRSERDELMKRMKPRSWVIAFQPNDDTNAYFGEWAGRQFAERSILWHFDDGPFMSHVRYCTSYWGPK